MPPRIGGKAPIRQDSDLYRLHHRIDNMFAFLMDWHLIGTRYDHCPILCFSTCALPAAALYWVFVLSLVRLPRSTSPPAISKI